MSECVPLHSGILDNNWPVIRDLVDEIITVSEEEIIRATELVYTSAFVRLFMRAVVCMPPPRTPRDQHVGVQFFHGGVLSVLIRANLLFACLRSRRNEVSRRAIGWNRTRGGACVRACV